MQIVQVQEVRPSRRQFQQVPSGWKVEILVSQEHPQAADRPAQHASHARSSGKPPQNPLAQARPAMTILVLIKDKSLGGSPVTSANGHPHRMAGFTCTLCQVGGKPRGAASSIR